MRIEWFHNGKPIPVGHRYRPAWEFSYVALDLLSVYTTDSGWSVKVCESYSRFPLFCLSTGVYSVRATNSLGSETCSCTLKVISRAEAELEGGYSAQGLEQLQYLEDSTTRYHKRTELVTEEIMKPRFLTKPKDLNLKEQMRAHFEASTFFSTSLILMRLHFSIYCRTGAN